MSVKFICSITCFDSDITLLVFFLVMRNYLIVWVGTQVLCYDFIDVNQFFLNTCHLITLSVVFPFVWGLSGVDNIELLFLNPVHQSVFDWGVETTDIELLFKCIYWILPSHYFSNIVESFFFLLFNCSPSWMHTLYFLFWCWWIPVSGEDSLNYFLHANLVVLYCFHISLSQEVFVNFEG